MSDNVDKGKRRGLWKKILLGLVIVLLGYLIFVCTELAILDYSRIEPYIYPDSDEYASLFWIEACMMVVLAELFTLCLIAFIRLHRQHTGAVLSGTTRKKLFIVSVVILAVLLTLCSKYGKIYHEASQAHRDFNYYHAERYYPFVIGAELDISFIIWLFIDWLKQRIAKAKEKKLTD